MTNEYYPEVHSIKRYWRKVYFNALHNYLWKDESPLWLRPQNEDRETFRADIYKQVVGHTPVEMIFEKDGIIIMDVFSTYRDGTHIGEFAMIVIDSETGEHE